MAKRVIAIFITGTAVLLSILYWGDPMCYGWIVAGTGWLDKCFKE